MKTIAEIQKLIEDSVLKLTSHAEWCFSSSTDPDLDREKFKGMAKTNIQDLIANILFEGKS